MRIQGHNVFAIAVSAIVMYAIGAVIYGLLFSETWMALSGVTEESFAGQEWRMYLSPVMPILLSIGLSLTIKWRGATGLAAGATAGILMALCFAFATNMYTFVYGTGPVGLLELDALHLFLIMTAGGAIIGAWK